MEVSDSILFHNTENPRKMDRLNVLLLDDEPAYLEELGSILNRSGYSTQSAETPSKAFTILEKNDIDVAIVDIWLPEMNGVEVIKRIREQYPKVSPIAITGHGDMKTVIDCLRAGAADFLNKPFQYPALENVIKRTSTFKELQDKIKNVELNYKHAQSALKEKFSVDIIGVSSDIKHVISMAAKVAETETTTVLITGESGTGKELVARSVHALSNRRSNFFHCVNCSAIPETLFESEFFGYKKGAFTGANESTKGWFEVSQNGTLFLDEVSELPLNLQAKFLRVLDDKMISKIGIKKGISVDLRIIAATNKELAEQVEKKEFRNDLYHRLNSFTINIPPLRERPEDIPELINYFTKQFARDFGKKVVDVDDAVYHKLSEYYFPGNVRELRNMVERAMILCDERVLKMKYFIGSRNNNESKETRLAKKDLNLLELEKKAITQALHLSSFNKSKASEMLGITRQALDRKIEKHDINQNS